MSTNDQISVIIPTKNRPDELKRFLKSLDFQSMLPNELIIVDASDDRITSDLIYSQKQRSEYDIKYIKSTPGLTIQKNIGVQNSRGKLLFFFDDDIVLDQKFIEIIYDTFINLEKYNVVGISGRITNIKASKDFIDRLFKKVFFLTDSGKGEVKRSGFPAHKVDSTLALVNVLPGGCTAFLKNVFLTYSFDENLTGYSYMEDVDFSYRVSKKFNLIYQPEAKCKHFATTYRTADTRELRSMLARNHFYLFKKNFSKDFPHIFAFAFSIIGLLIYNAIWLKDFKACIGIIEGLATPVKIDKAHKIVF